MIDRRGDQLGKVLVCVHAVTIQHRGRATRSIDHDTHGHRLGQHKARVQPSHTVKHEVCITKTKKQKARPKGGKPKGTLCHTLESESRNAIV